MEGFVIGVHGRVARVAGFYRPGALLESQSGARMLVVGRRRALHPHYLEALRLARDGEAIPAEHEVVSVSRALVVSEQVPEPGERVREVEWRADRPGVYGPEGEIDLLKHEGIPHISVIASTGMGKTTLIKMLLRRAADAGFKRAASAAALRPHRPRAPGQYGPPARLDVADTHDALPALLRSRVLQAGGENRDQGSEGRAREGKRRDAAT
jgi:hypothetical protein